MHGVVVQLVVLGLLTCLPLNGEIPGYLLKADGGRVWLAASTIASSQGHLSLEDLDESGRLADLFQRLAELPRVRGEMNECLLHLAIRTSHEPISISIETMIGAADEQVAGKNRATGSRGLEGRDRNHVRGAN